MLFFDSGKSARFWQTSRELLTFFPKMCSIIALIYHNCRCWNLRVKQSFSEVPKALIWKLIGLLVFFFLVLILNRFQFGCIFKRITGFDCISCGMTRACLHALRLDFAAAFSYHPMFWSVPVLVLEFLFDGKLFGKKVIDFWVIGLIVLGLLTVYVIRLTNPGILGIVI